MIQFGTLDLSCGLGSVDLLLSMNPRSCRRAIGRLLRRSLRTTFDVEHAINVLEPNVPTHALSTLDVGVFNVCLGKDKEASKVFLEFGAIHDKLRSDAILELTDELEWRLTLFLAPHLNSYPLTFKFPDDEVIKSPKCLYGHDYAKYLEGSCKNYRLFWICSNIAHML
ncbi:hypothetical protein YC2023_082159 [Brassica napus]|uniref:(rape) hypothetical protein n=1 Tax=Brassica napus TaxID=3708 RepID=A0A816LSF2_BRANA|nr:unnamed protein product [Brassica napus]